MTHRIQADIDELKRMLANEEFRAISVEASLGKEDTAWRATVAFTNGREVLALETSGYAATILALRLHTTRNSKGFECLRPYTTNSSYWLETEDLAKDYDKKLSDALRQLTSGQLRFDYDPTALMSDFLTSGTMARREVHPTKARLLRHSGGYSGAGQGCAEEPRTNVSEQTCTREYTKRVDDVLNRSYGSSHEPLDAYLRLRRSMPEDGSAIVARAWNQYRLAEDLRNRLAVQKVVPGEIGIPHLMDNYRRLSEALVPFIRVLSDGVCILDGRRPLQAGTGLAKRCKVIKDSKHRELLGSFDPAIRDSESHAGTDVCKENGTVILCDRSGGVRRVTGQYTFRQIVEMTRDLIENLFPAILAAVYLHELSLLLLAMRSRSYLDLLLCVGNLEHKASQ